jgi:tetratricopeptide (TPR) repeat protein
MNPLSKSFGFRMILGFSFLFAVFFLAPDVRAQSTIQGAVFDKQRNRLPDIDVELLNDYYQTVRRTKTDGAGNYAFGGLGNGRYTVRVYAFRYDLEDKEIPVEINTQNVRGGEGSGHFMEDFYLLPKKGGLRDAELTVVFAQEIPKEAQKLYVKALKDLSEKRTDEGILGLWEAIKISPNYYLALHRYGLELFIKKQYKDAYQVFLEAIKVNPKSATSYYYLGYALHNLGSGYNKSAFASLTQAVVLAPASPQVLWLLGKVERAVGKYAEAEQHLLKAKKLVTGKVPEIHMELADLYADDLKKYKEAADELELYLKASKLSKVDEEKWKKIIAGLRDKAKTQS